MNKKILFFNIIIFFGIVTSIEGSLRIAKYFKDTIKTLEQNSINKKNKSEPIPTKWEQVFHPGVGHSHQKIEFKKNVNTSSLNYDNISAIEIFQQSNYPSQELKILVLGGSSTDPLGTHFSGFRGTWVHHLFNKISQNNNSSRYKVDNAGNGGSTSSNELIRLITKQHENDYDLVISFNGINEYYFLENPYYQDKENVLASSMLLRAMGDSGIIKTLDNKTFISTSFTTFIKNSRTYLHLQNIKKKFSRKPIDKNSSEEYFLTSHEKKMLTYGANVWGKNIDFMNSISKARSSKYLAILQPTLGLGNEYCKNKSKSCMLTNQKYISKINFIYSLLRESCQKRSFCLDISKDRTLTSDESFYTDSRHPNNEGNRRIADQIRARVIQLLN